MTDTSGKLRACPFCGRRRWVGEGADLRVIEAEDGLYAVECRCGARGPTAEDRAAAFDTWNGTCSTDDHWSGKLFRLKNVTAVTHIRGMIKSVPAASVLQMLSSDQKTGILRFYNGEATRAICFDEGKVVAATGTGLPRLGKIVVSKGLLSEEQLEDAVKKSAKMHKRLGVTLLSEMYLSREALHDIVRHQIREVVLDVCTWKDGDFEFADCPMDFDTNGIPSTDALPFVMEAARTMDEWLGLEKGLADISVGDITDN